LSAAGACDVSRQRKNAMGDFHLLSPLHLAIIAVIPATAAVLAFTTRRLPSLTLPIRIALGTLLISDGLVWQFYRYYVHGIRFPEIAPLELCDASFWLTAAALLTLEEHTFDLAYYWGIAGSGMAVLTPYLRASLYTLQSVQFFVAHSLPIVGVLYLIWNGQARPRARSWWFAWWALNAFGLAVALVDFFGGTNFMYLRQKPGASSLFDVLGPWPWYLAAADLLALGIFWVMQRPFVANRLPISQRGMSSP
jgi:hypothetical integral membrane protein (TIGR02206 family)